MSSSIRPTPSGGVKYLHVHFGGNKPGLTRIPVFLPACAFLQLSGESWIFAFA
jgi:hypothetical protein